MPKAKTKGSKKRDGESNGNLNGESAKETMLSEMRVSGQGRLLLVVVLYTSVGYSQCQRSACGTRAEPWPNNRPCIDKAPKRIL